MHPSMRASRLLRGKRALPKQICQHFPLPPAHTTATKTRLCRHFLFYLQPILQPKKHTQECGNKQTNKTTYGTQKTCNNDNSLFSTHPTSYPPPTPLPPQASIQKKTQPPPTPHHHTHTQQSAPPKITNTTSNMSNTSSVTLEVYVRRVIAVQFRPRQRLRLQAGLQVGRTRVVVLTVFVIAGAPAGRFYIV